MAQQLGRIGGHLLSENLLREGIDLAFKNTSFDSTPLLYFDVENKRVGIKTDSPVYDLDIRTNLSTTNLGATDQMEIDQVYINADGFFTTGTGPLQITPAGQTPLIILERLTSDNLQINDNKISSFDNSIIQFDPNGSGTIELQSDVNLIGNISTSEDINIDGNLSTASNIIIGDSPLDTVTITPELEQGLTTGSDLEFNLGTATKRWAEIFSPDMTNITNVNPEAVRVSSQMLIDGVNNEINTLQSNDFINLITGKKPFITKEILNPNAFGSAQDDRFGSSVSTSENYSVIGTIFEDDAEGETSGVVYIYDNQEQAVVHTLTNPNPSGISENDFFGYAVDIDDLYTIVGAPREDSISTTGTFNEGKAYIYDTFFGTLLYTLNDPISFATDSQDQFGFSVTNNSASSFVSAPRINDSNGFNSGKVFEFSNTSGNLIHTFENPNPISDSDNDRFGHAIDCTSDLLAISAFREDDIGVLNSGKVYIFDIQTKSLIFTLDNPNDSGTADGDQFGSSLSISDNFIVVGAYNESSNDGRVYVFNISDGTLLHTLSNPTSESASRFGYSVSVSDNKILVGAPDADDSSESNNGKSFIFSADTGILDQTLENPSATGSGTDDNFGLSVSIFKNNNIANSFFYCLVGAPRADRNSADTGKTFLFTFNKFPLEIESTTWQNSSIINQLDSPLTLESSGIGYSRFMGTAAIQVPFGANITRPPTPEVGDTRWNTEEQYLECFDGTVYVVSIGAGDPVTEENMEDFGTIYSLFLG